MNIGFDVISDLYLKPNESFNWEGKATSLYCVIAGNISNDLRTIKQTLLQLTKHYQGVFYTPGSLEYEGVADIDTRTHELLKITEGIRNIAFLHHHVAIVDGIAVVGVNGWYGNSVPTDLITEQQIEDHRHEDISYLKNTIDKLQRHLDVTKIMIVSNSAPSPDLFFGEEPKHIETQLPISLALFADTELKVSYWVYGTYRKIVDTKLNGINYVNNGCFGRTPYWPTRITVC
jgi:hypothetical protein